MEEKLSHLEEKLSHLEEKVDNLKPKLDKIIFILENDISSQCYKMSKHIDFIDTVYDTVKKPLGFVCNRVMSLMGTTQRYQIIHKNPPIDN
tara:strand:- start:12971 stop:13243 length:273 start_codon:yes stop_codon:yes gene_type:complete